MARYQVNRFIIQDTTGYHRAQSPAALINSFATLNHRLNIRKHRTDQLLCYIILFVRYEY